MFVHLFDLLTSLTTLREFLDMIGERCRLRGFDKYRGGLDTVHDLTGTESYYTSCKGTLNHANDKSNHS